MDKVGSYIQLRLFAALLTLGVVAWAYWAEGLEVFLLTMFIPVTAVIAVLVSVGWLGEAALAAVSSEALRKSVAQRVESWKPDAIKEAEVKSAAA